jgi:hypothetical protein
MVGMIAFLVLIGALVPLVSGFSTGAGSCAGNGAPVGGKHLTRLEETSGSLEAYDISITLGSSDPFEVGVPFEFESGKPHFLTMSCSSFNPYLGFLLRLASPDGIDTTTALIPFPTDSDAQVATDTCINIEGVGGITHTNNEPKSLSRSILQMDEAAQGLVLDVTIVVANAGFYSEFYYSQYILNAVAPIRPPGGTPSFVSSSMFQPTAEQDVISSPTPAIPTASSVTVPTIGTPDKAQVEVTVPTTPDVQITVPTTPGYPLLPTTTEGVAASDAAPSKGQGASQDTAPVAAPVTATDNVFAPAVASDDAPATAPGTSPVATPTVFAPAAAPTKTPAGTADDSPAATTSGIQDESAASASRDTTSSGVSSRHGISGFTTYATTLSLLVFTTFYFAL